MANENVVKGYKVFDPNWVCRTKQYTCPGKFEEDGKLEICSNGMHFCKKAADCFNYYNFDPNNHVAEVVAYGTVIEKGNKCCTDKLEIVREIPWTEVLEIVNSGSGNSGNRNSGNCNSGNWNSGNWNSGDCNSGDWNSGNWNSGDWNSGDCNSGNWNSGDWNSGDYSNGCFNTFAPKIHLFNKLSEWTYEDWLNSEARCLLARIDCNVVEWVNCSDMTDSEKEQFKSAETTGGYLKVLNNSECAEMWWRGLSEEEKGVIKSIPNFDPDIFKEIVGVDVNEEDNK